MQNTVFDIFALNDTKYQIDLRKYTENVKGSSSSVEPEKETEADELLANTLPAAPVSSPHISPWDFLPKRDIVELLELEKASHIRKYISTRWGRNLKGAARIVLRELMYTVAKFCRKNKFNVEQTGAVLSQFHYTHLFSLSGFGVGAEKVYEYFKAFQFCHSLPFPPDCIKIFNLEETRAIMAFFCRIYLRNLPIIVFVCLPKFSLQVNCPVPPDVKKKGKGRSEKRGKKNKKK